MKFSAVKLTLLSVHCPLALPQSHSRKLRSVVLSESHPAKRRSLGITASEASLFRFLPIINMQPRSNSTLPGPSIDVDSNARDETVKKEPLNETALDVDGNGMEDVGSSDTERMKEQIDVVMNDVEPSAQVYEVISGFEFVDPNEMLLQKKIKENGEMRSTLMWEVWEEEHRRWIDQNITGDVDLDQQNTMSDELHEAPSELATELLRFQKEWLAWALKQEESVTRGGILADEMGMGKTVQAIALVLAKRDIRRAINGADESDLSPRLSTALPVVNCTLVICPTSALNPWKREIEQFTREGSTKVMCYHGPKRVKGYLQFLEYDFVITTYNIVEADYRNAMSPKQKCQSCGKKYHERSIDNHRKYCGKRKNSDFGKELKLCGEYDLSKDSGSQSEPEDDYNVEANVRNSALHSIKWERIVLDEAHWIKNKSNNTAKAVYALESSYKWALSGTPLQNRVAELYSLIRFLQVAPYSYYFCEDCDCRILDNSSSSDCEGCPHKSYRHFCWWNKNVEVPITRHGNFGEGQRAMFLLKHKILKSILLRRTKDSRASDVALPSRVVSVRRDFLDDKEEDYYQLLYNESQAQFNIYVGRGTVMNNYAHIFALLTRLRQALDHPYLVQFSHSNSLRNESDNSEQTCGICHDPVEDPTVASCGHLFCKICFNEFSSSLGQSSCPSCSKPTADFTSNSSTVAQRSLLAADGFKFKSSSILNRINLDNFQTSTKIEALREEIRKMIDNDGSAKGIVFSQFTSFLDLIMYSLKKSGITCVLLDGSMPTTARDNAIKRFNEDSDCRVFLISLKAGGVALNLTVASHVFLMDPWWNPATERQAMDRIHRIGQSKPIRIVRFVIADTIEERILKLQEKKELVFEGTVGGSSNALARLTVADLKSLFLS